MVLYIDYGLNPSTTYYYKLAKDDAGNIDPLSFEKSTTTNAATRTWCNIQANR